MYKLLILVQAVCCIALLSQNARAEECRPRTDDRRMLVVIAVQDNYVYRQDVLHVKEYKTAQACADAKKTYADTGIRYRRAVCVPKK